MTYGDFDYLISGDLIGRGTSNSIDAKVEDAVGQAIANTDHKVDILHVNHHGADNGSAASFLDLVKPNIAIISAGNGNNHKHPKNAALERLYDADIYRIIQTSWGTSEETISKRLRYRQAIYQNDVVITTDGVDYTLSTSRKYETDKNYVTDQYRNAAERNFRPPVDY